MDAFISYAHANRSWAGAVKEALAEFGFDAFLAHEDLQLSEEWKDRILEELANAKLFAAILSKEFKGSEWCAQEVGYIVSRSKEVLILPLSIDRTTPYGFISHLQCSFLKSRDDALPVITQLMFRRRPKRAIAAQIHRVRKAPSWRDGEAEVKPLVPHFGSFTDEHVTQFAKAAMLNSQVWDASLCKTDYLPQFAKTHWAKIPKDLRAEFIRKLDLPKSFGRR